MASMEEKLLMGVLNQFEVGRIDFDELADYIDVATSKAARCRWDRYKQKLKGAKAQQPISPRKAAGVGKKVGLVSSKKAGGSPKKNERGSPKKSRGRAKKRESDENEEEEVENLYEEEENEERDYGEEGADVSIKLEEPLRKLPSLRARVATFVEEASDAEDEQDEEDMEVQEAGAEVEGLQNLAVKDEDEDDGCHIEDEA